MSLLCLLLASPVARAAPADASPPPAACPDPSRPWESTLRESSNAPGIGSSGRPFIPGLEPPGRLGGASTRPYWRTNLFKRIGSDQLFLVRTWWPSEIRRVDFSLPLVVAVAGASGSSGNGIDYEVQRDLAEWTTGGRRDVAEALTEFGNTQTGVVLLGGSYLISRWAGKDRLRRATSLSSEALVNAGLYTSLLKRVTRRTRPASGGNGEFFVQSPQNGQEATSFPSGHASGAFAVATVFASEYRDRRWVPWVTYGTAGLISLSRVALGRHFPSDVIVGALLGRSMGRMVVRRNGGGDADAPVSRVEPWFDPDNQAYGIRYSRTW